MGGGRGGECRRTSHQYRLRAHVLCTGDPAPPLSSAEDTSSGRRPPESGGGADPGPGGHRSRDGRAGLHSACIPSHGTRARGARADRCGAYRRAGARRRTMSMRNALTFDIEEYFHAEAFARAVRPEEWPGLASRVVDTTERLLDILDYADAHATFFVLGWVAERYPALVQDIAARGHEVACHGYGHQMIHRQTRLDFGKDVKRVRTAMKDAAGTDVVDFRAPRFWIPRR